VCRAQSSCAPHQSAFMGKHEELTPEETDRNIEMWKIKRVRTLRGAFRRRARSPPP
jgi:hypothetical protein